MTRGVQPVTVGEVRVGDPVGPAPRVDGRTLRSQRTREAIVTAHLSLLDDGDLKPTAERIAERAGVSIRALWTHFPDLEALFAASGLRLWELLEAASDPVSPDRPLAERVDAYCRQRVRLLEILAPAARAARAREPLPPQLRANRTDAHRRVRSELDLLFRPELPPDGEQRTRLLQALGVAVSWSSYGMLRDEFGLDEEAARQVMILTVRVLLGLGPDVTGPHD